MGVDENIIAILPEVRAEGDETSLQNQERRNYTLNERKSMKKTLLATEKDSITVVRTYGGIKIELNKTDLSTYTGDNPNKDILTCVTSVSCVAIVALTNVARHVVFTSTIYTRGWCTMIYNCEIMYKIRGLVWVLCGLYKQKLIDM